MKNHRVYLGEKAFAAVLANLPSAKTDALKLARQWKRKNNTLTKTAETIWVVTQLIVAGRNARFNKRIRPYNWDIARANENGEKPVLLPQGTLEQRLAKFRQDKWEKATRSLLCSLENVLGYVAHSTRGYVRKIIPEPNTISEPSAWVASRDEGRYSSRCTFHKISHGVRVQIHPDWPEKVAAQGLTELHGLTTLSAEVEAQTAGETIWRAIWASKGRGCSFNVERGYIVKRGNEFAHGSSIAAARSTLTRREQNAQFDRLKSIVERRLEENRLNGAGEIQVTIADSVRAGNCRAGTEAFRNRYFPERDSASVREVLDTAEIASQKRFAIAACVQALRRNRYVPTEV